VCKEDRQKGGEGWYRHVFGKESAPHCRKGDRILKVYTEGKGRFSTKGLEQRRSNKGWRGSRSRRPKAVKKETKEGGKKKSKGREGNAQNSRRTAGDVFLSLTNVLSEGSEGNHAKRGRLGKIKDNSPTLENERGARPHPSRDRK